MGERERIKLTRTYCKSYMKFKAYILSAILSSICHIYIWRIYPMKSIFPIQSLPVDVTAGQVTFLA